MREKATSALRWSALDQIVRRGVLFVGSMIMARLVEPEAFGVVALLMLFTGVAGIFIDGGFSAALIQKKEISDTDKSTVFWFNLAAGLLMSCGLFFGAPAIARFFNLPQLELIGRIYAFQFILGSSNAVHGVLFARALNFKTPLYIGVLTSIPSLACGIFMAWKGYGVWALVAQTMVGAVLTSAFTWSFSKWRPSFIFSKDSFRSLAGFGGFYFAARLLDVAYQKLYTLMIGKWYGVHDLALFNRADATKQLPTATFSGVLSRVAFPIFSRLSDNIEELRRVFKLTIRCAMFVNIPMMLGIALVAEPLVLTLFGPNWIESAGILQILALAGILWPLHLLNLSVLQAMGHSGKFFKLEIMKKIIGISLIVTGSFYGVQGLAWSMVISSCISSFLNTFYTGKMLNYGLFKQFADVAPSAGCGVAMAAAVYMCSKWFQLVPPVQLAVLVLLGLSVYLGMAKLFRLAELEEGIRLVMRRRVK